MNIKLIATDMDGTLLDTDHATIPSRDLTALRAAAEQGVQLVIASGRSWTLIKDTARTLGQVQYAITGNGSLTLNTVTGEILDKRGMDRSQCADIIRVLRRHHLAYELYIDGQNYVERTDLAHAKDYGLSPQFLELFLRCVTQVDDMLEQVKTASPEKFDVFYVPPQVRTDLLADLHATGLFNGASAITSSLELTSADVNKGLALEALCTRLGIARDEVMAFGDADNDLEMLAWAGHSFAMANGTDNAKAAARYLTATNHDAGIAQAVERYVLAGAPVGALAPF